MNGLIKAQDVASISAKVRSVLEARPLAKPLPAADQIVPAELIALRLEIEKAGQDLRQRDAEIEVLRSDVGRAYHDGEAKGRKAGLKEADQRRADQLLVLEQGIERALGLLSNEFASFEQLAVLVAHEALSKIVGDPINYTQLIGEIIRQQLVSLEVQSLVYILVSRDDFSDAGELEHLAERVGKAGVDIRASTELAGGECQIRLALGSLEVGVGQQWDRLSLALKESADAEQTP